MNNTMKYENVLPEDFDGVFKFTNWTDEEFVGKWGNVEYRFPAQSTSPMIMPFSPLEIQNIRKKFAKDLAEQQFFKSKEYKRFISQEKNPDGSVRLNSIHQAGSYSDSELTENIQRCLAPLPVSKVIVTESKKADIADKLSVNNKGVPNTTVLDENTSLREKALNS